MVHEFDPDRAPDSEFEDGELHHLVVGNSGRMLDPRRTPIVVTDLQSEVGMFRLEVTAFEDAGASWSLPFEDVSNFQFANGSLHADPQSMAEFSAAVERLDQPLVLPANDERRRRTDQLVNEERDRVREWLQGDSAFFASGRPLGFSEREGEEALYQDLQSVMASRGLGELEETFAENYVSNPYSGELVKGHLIVLAEMGLCRYEGKLIRDPALFSAPWTRERRRAHIVARLALLREVFLTAGHETVPVYRAWAAETPPEPHGHRSLVSVTFSQEVAHSFFEGSTSTGYGALVRQAVPIDRLFMTYLETEQMNRRYKEAEAVLLADPTNPMF